MLNRVAYIDQIPGEMLLTLLTFVLATMMMLTKCWWLNVGDKIFMMGTIIEMLMPAI